MAFVEHAPEALTADRRHRLDVRQMDRAPDPHVFAGRLRFERHRLNDGRRGPIKWLPRVTIRSSWHGRKPGFGIRDSVTHRDTRD